MKFINIILLFKFIFIITQIGSQQRYLDIRLFNDPFKRPNTLSRSGPREDPEVERIGPLYPYVSYTWQGDDHLILKGGGLHFFEINILTLKILEMNNLSSSGKK